MCTRDVVRARALSARLARIRFRLIKKELKTKSVEK
jgi:hypothetical protein